MIILPLTLLVMLVAATLRFGWAGLVRLALHPPQGGLSALLACGAQALSVWTHQYLLVLLIVSAIFLATFCWQNRNRAGFVVLAIGIMLNVSVMVANGGTMPISSITLQRMQSIPTGSSVDTGVALAQSKDRVLDDGRARLVWLSDWLLLPGPFARLAAWSAGDALMLAGLARLLWYTMKGELHDRTL